MSISRERIVALVLVLWPLVASAQGLKTQEEITVERILIDARVTDSHGEPLVGLTPSDFRVKVDGKLAVVESVDWIPDTAAARALSTIDESSAAAGDSAAMPAPNGRLFIYFFQTDFARNAARVGGQMHLLANVDGLVDSLEENDRVAVLSFDSRLKFRLDFSSDKAAIKHAMTEALSIDDPQRPQPVPNPSLATRLTPDAINNAQTCERALLLLANALHPIAGPKSLILFGWGLGVRTRGSVQMTPEYAIARHALESARVTVFSLDTTIADYHDLELGLGKVAADTGGFYAKTHIFPQIALERLEKTLTGHYELEVRKPDTKIVGVHTIDVQTTKRGADVMARTSYIDQSKQP